MRYELFDYDDGSEGNLQCVDEPEGWHYTQWMMLCPECHVSFRNWMGECIGKNKELMEEEHESLDGASRER